MARTANSPIPAKLRAKKGDAASRQHDGDALDEAASDCGRTSAGRTQWRVLGALGLIQAFCLVGFAHMARHKKGVLRNEDTPAVRVLTDETLPFFVAGYPNGTLLYFHTAGCVHCKSLTPAFDAAARELQARGSAPLASVSLAAAPLAAERYGVRRVPTMLWFKKGQPVLELPPTARTTAKITEYVGWALQPAVVGFGTRQQLEEAIPQLRAALHPGAAPVVVGFPSRAGAREALEAAAERSRGKTVFLFVEESFDDDPVLRAYSQDPANDQEYRGEVSPEAADAWVKTLFKKA